MKRFLSLFVFVCLLALSITACNDGNNDNSDDAKYAEAITLLEQGKNAEAYDILCEIGRKREECPPLLRHISIQRKEG